MKKLIAIVALLFAAPASAASAKLTTRQMETDASSPAVVGTTSGTAGSSAAVARADHQHGCTAADASHAGCIQPADFQAFAAKQSVLTGQDGVTVDQQAGTVGLDIGGVCDSDQALGWTGTLECLSTIANATNATYATSAASASYAYSAGSAATATSASHLQTNGSNCIGTSWPRGVDASGNAECETLDPADINLPTCSSSGAMWRWSTSVNGFVCDDDAPYYPLNPSLPQRSGLTTVAGPNGVPRPSLRTDCADDAVIRRVVDGTNAWWDCGTAAEIGSCATGYYMIAAGSTGPTCQLVDVTTVTGTLPIGHGGTGLSATNTYGVIYSIGTSLASSLAGTDGYPFVSQGGNYAPQFQKIDVSAATTGTLPYARGGTGVTGAADDAVLVGSGTGWSAKTLPDCDTVGSVLQYDQGTNSFTCRTAENWTLITSWSGGWGNLEGTDANYFRARYRKGIDGRVHLRGVIAGGTSGSAAFTLPTGYRPTAAIGFATDAGGSAGFVHINSAGNVMPIGSNSYVYLDGVAFYPD